MRNASLANVEERNESNNNDQVQQIVDRVGTSIGLVGESPTRNAADAALLQRQTADIELREENIHVHGKRGGEEDH